VVAGRVSPLRFLPYCPLPFPAVRRVEFFGQNIKFYEDKRMKELSIIQKTYDLIKWYVPILNRLPKAHKFTLADRLINRLYDLLEGLIQARYAKQKLAQLEALNTQIDIIRYQTRLLLDFQLIAVNRNSSLTLCLILSIILSKKN
jgi:hypothetical protein